MFHLVAGGRFIVFHTQQAHVAIKDRLVICFLRVQDESNTSLSFTGRGTYPFRAALCARESSRCHNVLSFSRSPSFMPRWLWVIDIVGTF